MIPRLLLHRPARGGLIPRGKLRERFEKFAQGQKLQTVSAALEEEAHIAVVEGRRQDSGNQSRSC